MCYRLIFSYSVKYWRKKTQHAKTTGLWEPSWDHSRSFSRSNMKNPRKIKKKIWFAEMMLSVFRCDVDLFKKFEHVRFHMWCNCQSFNWLLTCVLEVWAQTCHMWYFFLIKPVMNNTISIWFFRIENGMGWGAMREGWPQPAMLGKYSVKHP